MNRRRFLQFLSLLPFYSPLLSAFSKNISTNKIVVVGSGIIGTCIAYELSKYGASVTLIDKYSPGAGTSGSSFNWINATYPKKPFSYNYLSQLGISAYKELSKELSFPLSWTGSLEWFELLKDEKKLIKAVKDLQNYPKHLPHHIISSEDATMHEPNILFQNRVVYSETDGFVDTDKLIALLISRIKSLGNQVLYPCKYQNINYRNNKLESISTSTGKIYCNKVIFASGIDTNHLLKFNYLKPPTPGVIVHTKSTVRKIKKIIVGPGIHVYQKPNGVLVLGEQEGAPINHKERLQDYPKQFPNRALAKQHSEMMFSKARNFFKNIKDIQYDKSFIGWRPLPIDNIPIIGKIDHLPNTYLAVMHSGISLGPIVGKLVAKEVLSGVDSMLLSDFRPSRLNK